MASKPISYEWQFPVAATNRRTNRKRLRAGELSLCEGVDGRYTGGLRKYYGFRRLDFWTQGSPNHDEYRFPFLSTDDYVVDAWYASVRKGTSSDWLNGFVVLWYDDSGSDYRLEWYYYDESDTFWHYTNIMGGAMPGISGYTLTASSVIDVAPAGKFMYIAVEDSPPVVLWHDGTSTKVEEMGPGADFDSAGDTGLAAPTDGGEGAGGYLKEDGTYAYAYRFYDSDRGIYSAISSRLEDTISGADQKVTLTNPDADPDRAYDAGYDELHVYRTLSAEVAGTSYIAGLLFKESEYDLDSDADCWPTTVEVGVISDDELVLGQAFDPNRDVSGSPVSGGAIANFEGVTFIGDPDESQMHWSQLHRHNPEVFPVTGHTYRWTSDDGHVMRFAKGGDHLYAFTDNAAFRIAKAGAQIGIGRMHSGRTLVSRRAISEMGRDVLSVTSLGVTVFDGATGKLSTMGAFDRILFDDWASTLDDIYMASDGPTGATYILNTGTKEAAVVWHVTGAITSMSDMRFVAVTEGPHPEDGGKSRAMFVTPEGCVVYPDEDLSGSGTMLDIPANTLHGSIAAADAGTGTTISSASIPGTFDQRHVGAYLHWTSGTNKGSYGCVATESSGVITISDSFTMAEGDTFEMSPVPFKVRPWPMPRMSNPYQDFGRRVAKGGQLQVVDLVAAEESSSYWTVGICRAFADTPVATVEVDMDENPSDQGFRLNVDGIDVEPYVQAIVSGGKWELLGIAINGTMTVSRNVE